MSTASESHSGSPNGHQVVQSERATRADHVGDRVGHPELHRNLDGAVEPDHRRLNPARRQVFSHQMGERGGDPLAREVLDAPLPPGRRGVAERRRAESECKPLADGRVGLGGQIAAGDAEVQLPRPDVDGNVLGPQKEELDVVDRVDDGQILGVAPPPVPGLRQDLGGRFGQRALVGYGDPERCRS